MLAAVTLLAIAVSVLLGSLERTAIQAERQSVQLALNQLRSALVIKGAEVMLTGGKLEAWQGTNPIELLQQPPLNWAGPCRESESQRGSWCFHARTGVLEYQPRWLGEGDVLHWFGANNRLKWRVEPEYTQLKRSREPRATGLQLSTVKSG